MCLCVCLWQNKRTFLSSVFCIIPFCLCLPFHVIKVLYIFFSYIMGVGAFFLLLSFIFFYRVSKKRWINAIFASLCSLYVHYVHYVLSMFKLKITRNINNALMAGISFQTDRESLVPKFSAGCLDLQEEPGHSRKSSINNKKLTSSNVENVF